MPSSGFPGCSHRQHHSHWYLTSCVLITLYVRVAAKHKRVLLAPYENETRKGGLSVLARSLENCTNAGPNAPPASAALELSVLTT